MKIGFDNKNNQNLVFFFLKYFKKNVLISEKEGNTNLFMPNKIASRIEGETLRPIFTEFCV